MLVVLVAALFGVLDACHILGVISGNIDLLCEQYLPLYAYYAAWLVPTLIALLIGIGMSRSQANAVCAKA